MGTRKFIHLNAIQAGLLRGGYSHKGDKQGASLTEALKDGDRAVIVRIRYE